jgi:hypothetical protein
MTAPEASVTVPESVLPATWARAGTTTSGLNASVTPKTQLVEILIRRILDNMVASKSRLTYFRRRIPANTPTFETHAHASRLSAKLS